MGGSLHIYVNRSLLWVGPKEYKGKVHPAEIIKPTQQPVLLPLQFTMPHNGVCLCGKTKIQVGGDSFKEQVRTILQERRAVSDSDI